MVRRKPARPAFPLPPVGAVQVVLAAGSSSRMGTPKPLLDFDGRTALELVLEAGLVGGVAWSIVVAAKGHEPAIAVAVARSGARVRMVVNPDPASEQIRSLQIALETLRGAGLDGFFIHPADYPLALAEDYRLLLEALGKQEGARVFIPSHGNRRGHPILCAPDVLPELLALPPGGTARDVISRAKVAHVPTPNPGVIEDMDTPAEYRRLLEMHRARSRAPREGAARGQPP